MTQLQTLKTHVRLSDVFPEEAILFGLKGGREHVFSELLHKLVPGGHLQMSAVPGLLETLLGREPATGLLNGIAFPHARCAELNSFVGALGIDAEGAEFNALDSRPAHLVFLTLSPPHRHGEHFDLLGRITSIGMDKATRLYLLGCSTAHEVWHVLKDLDRD